MDMEDGRDEKDDIKQKQMDISKKSAKKEWKWIILRWKG
jgi:hypothetical protein